MTKKTRPIDQVEQMIDDYGMDLMLKMMSSVCRAKGEHIRDNWQDHELADEWDKAAEKLEQLTFGGQEE